MKSTPFLCVIFWQSARHANGFLQLPQSAMPATHHRSSAVFADNIKLKRLHVLLLSTDGTDKDSAAAETNEVDDPPVPQLTIPRSAPISNTESESNGPGLITGIFAAGVLLFFAASALLPLLEVTSTAPTANSNLGSSVVTRQQTPVKSYESKFDALSKSKIQEKLSNLPVFYLVNDGAMSDKIYFSYNEAESAAKGTTVKATTLDQVLYPLILKQGKVKTASPTPAAVKLAIETASETQYTLVPSASSLKDAKETGTSLEPNDIPLFIAERLAFASDAGAQVPLFLEKNDAITSYNRLRESGGGKLPAEAVVRTSSLMDVLESMERGTRQGTSQLAFYANADDVLKADEMAP